MKITNIEIKQRLKEIEKSNDPYFKTKSLCELAGAVAFYGHTIDNTMDSIMACNKMAMDTINTLIKRHNL